MQVALGHEFGTELLKHLGIEWEHVKGFTIRAYVGEAVTITVERLLRTGDEGAVKQMFDEYEVVKKGAPDLRSRADL